jgi:hypothetical protein
MKYDAKYWEFKKLVGKAEAAGRKAAEASPCQRIQVKNMKTGKVYDPFPICGFAWVVVKPNRGAFAKFLKEEAGFKKHWAGGLSNWIGDYEQSYDMKRAHAYAYAKVLSEAGYNAYADSRLD